MVNTVHTRSYPISRWVLKYRALVDAFIELRRPEQVRRVFVGFQRNLYAAKCQSP